MTLYIGDEDLNYTLIGATLDNEEIGSPTGPNYFGRASDNFISEFGWLGALDGVRIGDRAVHPTDSDGDGVPNDDDICSDTALPEVNVPTNGLKPNHYADTDGDGTFNAGQSHGQGQSSRQTFTLIDTSGCSCEQIIEAMELGHGHKKHGCSSGAIIDWIALLVQKSD